jgi:heme exporter protein D
MKEIFQDWEDFLAMNMKQRFSWLGKKQQTKVHHCAIKKTN